MLIVSWAFVSANSSDLHTEVVCYLWPGKSNKNILPSRATHFPLSLWSKWHHQGKFIN